MARNPRFGRSGGSRRLTSLAAAVVIRGGGVVITPSPTPTLTLSQTSPSIASNAAAGTLVSNISNVPAGATPTVTPNDGRLVIAGDATAGWKVVVGMSALSAGTVNFSIAATGATGASGTLTVTAASGPVTAVIPLLGQSIQAGRDVWDPTLDASDPNVYQYGQDPSDTATFGLLTNDTGQLHHPEGQGGSKRTGPGQAYAKAVLATLPAGSKVVLIPCAWGGTSMVNTASNSAPNAPQWAVGRSLYEAAITATISGLTKAQELGLPVVFHSTFFVQGNTDSLVELVSQYDTAYRAVIPDWRSRVPGAATKPWVTATQAPENNEVDLGKSGIDDVHRAIASSVSNVSYIPISYNAKLADDIHITAAASRLLGDRGGKAAAGIPCVGFDRVSKSVAEGNSGTTTVTIQLLRSTPVGALSVPLTFTPGGTSADDFVNGYPTGLVANFVAGSLVASVSYGIAGDTVGEGDEPYAFGVTPPAPYIVSTRPILNGQIINDDAGAPPGTNLLPQPNAFESGTVLNGTVTPNTTANPVGGAMTADTYNEGSTSAVHGVVPLAGANLTAGQPYTSACDVQMIAGEVIQINHSSALGASSTTMWQNFVLPASGSPVLGSGGSNAAGNILALGGGVYRISVTFTPSSGGPATFTLCRVPASNSARNAASAGVNGPGFIAANAQIVAGTVANAF